jgi:hypothetical protein
VGVGREDGRRFGRELRVSLPLRGRLGRGWRSRKVTFPCRSRREAGHSEVVEGERGEGTIPTTTSSSQVPPGSSKDETNMRDIPTHPIRIPRVA